MARIDHEPRGVLGITLGQICYLFDRHIDKVLENANFKSVSGRIFEILAFEKSRKRRKMVP